ncbi:MAG TPA: hypothetical protein VK211_10495 [Kamptonema sp.]|nr:hypothetical protein [Kamptonema sp.]
MAIKIKLWADYGCWPIWGVDEIDNIDPAEMPLSLETITRLNLWQEIYDATLNQEYPPWSAFPSQKAEEVFKQDGIELWKQLRFELAPDYEVFYQTEGKLLKHPDELLKVLQT